LHEVPGEGDVSDIAADCLAIARTLQPFAEQVPNPALHV
jgi:hypothetical protein